MLRGLGFSVALALAVLLCPRSVRACSAWPECSSPTGTIPYDGAEGVPLNVELEAYVYWPDHRESIPVTLRVAETGASVPVDASSTPGRFRAMALLEPATRYELVGPATTTTRDAAMDCDATPSVLATFTTGEGSDTIPPSTPVTTSHGCRVESCDSSACCGPYVAAISSASWHADDEGGFPVSYAYGSPTGPRTAIERGTSADFVYGIGRIAGLSDFPIEAAGPIYAIDIAGNVSADGAGYSLDFSCAPTDPSSRFDAGRSSPDASAPSDASRPSDAGAPNDASSPMDASAGVGGCGVGRRPGGAWLAPLLLLLLAIRRWT